MAALMHTRWNPLLAAALMLVADAASAEPMDLGNLEPRWITVRFEISPSARPLQRNAHYTEPLPAWLEPGALPGELKVTVAGRLVEQHMMDDQEPVPGSFSDFVWAFDTRTGHVRSATLSGVLLHRVRLGLSDLVVKTPIRVAMDTASPAGYGRTTRLFGHRILGFCEPSTSKRCQAVRPSLYDPKTGYVNALGRVSADARVASIRSYSPLGEAVFSEAEPQLASEGTPPVSLAPPASQLLN